MNQAQRVYTQLLDIHNKLVDDLNVRFKKMDEGTIRVESVLDEARKKLEAMEKGLLESSQRISVLEKALLRTPEVKDPHCPFEVGGVYRTRNDKRVNIIRIDTDLELTFPVVGIIDGYHGAFTWQRNGTYRLSGADDMDLLTP
jgi:hypothetical protein